MLQLMNLNINVEKEISKNSSNLLLMFTTRGYNKDSFNLKQTFVCIYILTKTVFLILSQD